MNIINNRQPIYNGSFYASEHQFPRFPLILGGDLPFISSSFNRKMEKLTPNIPCEGQIVAFDLSSSQFIAKAIRDRTAFVFRVNKYADSIIKKGEEDSSGDIQLYRKAYQTTERPATPEDLQYLFNKCKQGEIMISYDACQEGGSLEIIKKVAERQGYTLKES